MIKIENAITVIRIGTELSMQLLGVAVVIIALYYYDVHPSFWEVQIINVVIGLYRAWDCKLNKEFYGRT